MEYISESELNTYELANNIARKLKGGQIILLNGDLGAGKTTFVKGIAKALGIKENVTSPTFTLLKTYQANNFTIVHVDAYRLEGEAFEELEDYINDENVIFIEWSCNLNDQKFFKENLTINIEYIGNEKRKFTIQAFGSKYEDFLNV